MENSNEKSKEETNCCELCFLIYGKNELGCKNPYCTCHKLSIEVSKHTNCHIIGCGVCDKTASELLSTPNLTPESTECKHEMIENNMIPDTCRDCGKVLVESTEMEEWDMLALILNQLPDIDPYDDEKWMVDRCLPKFKSLLSSHSQKLKEKIEGLENKHKYLNEAYKVGYNHCIKDVINIINQVK